MAAIESKIDRTIPNLESSLKSLGSVPNVKKAVNKKKPVKISDCSGISISPSYNLK
jgi:hypothetical protein